MNEAELLFFKLCFLTPVRRPLVAEQWNMILPAPWAEAMPKIFHAVEDGIDLGKFRAEGYFAALNMGGWVNG